MNNDKELRRKKRQLKKAQFFEKHGLIKKLFGDSARSIVFHPDKDPKKNNHRRVVEQRVLSKRLDLDNYRKVKH